MTAESTREEALRLAREAGLFPVHPPSQEVLGQLAHLNIKTQLSDDQIIRLVAAGKKQALREAAAACVSVHDERKRRSGTDFGFNAIMECKEAIERMASEHEGSGK
jgi:hypothetical protein